MRFSSRQSRELAEEMRQHIEGRIEDLMAAGLDREHAEIAARRAFGNIALHQEDSRAVWTWTFLENFMQDVRYAVRVLGRNKLFAFAAIAVLALGLGANTAIFSVVDAVLLRPLPYPDASRLVVLDEYKLQAGSRTVSWPDFRDWRASASAFSELAAYRLKQVTLTGLDKPQLLSAAEVSASFFSLTGANPILGRVFTEAEDRPGANPAAVISYALWRNRLGGDPAIIGKTLKLNGTAFTAAGVLPPDFDYFRGGADLYVPAGLNGADPLWNRRGFHPELLVLARLKPGMNIAEAQASMNTLMSALERQYPQSNAGLRASVTDLRQFRTGPVKPLLLTLFAAVGAILLIACANIANLLVARGAARGPEMAVRVALGAGARRLMRQLLTESVLLAVLGSGAGLLLAYVSIGPLLRFAPADLPRLASVSFDARVFGFALAASLVTGILFGLAPAIQSARVDIQSSLKEAGRSTQRGLRFSFRSGLYVFEIAMAVILTLASGLLVRSLLKAEAVDPGFDPARVLALDVTLAPDQYQQAERKVTFFTQAVERVRALAGVSAASAVGCPPSAGTCLNATSGAFWIEGQSAPSSDTQLELPTALFNIAAPGYFEAMRIPLAAGRYFTGDDRARTRPVVVINETMARRWWPDRNPVGQRIKEGGPHSTQPYREIIGVAGDVKQQGLDLPQAAEAYLPLAQFPFAPWDSLQAMTFVARAQGEPSGIASAAEQAIRAVDKDLPLTRVQPMTQYLAESLERRRFSTMLLGLFAALALMLAAVGIYGVMAYSVSRQVREIGIRMALGATRADILQMTLRTGMSLAAVGIGIGLTGAELAARLLGSLLFGISPADPVTFCAVAALLAAVALAACYLPARRGMAIDPVHALRNQ